MGTRDKVVDANDAVSHLKHRIKDWAVVKMGNVGPGVSAESGELYYKSIIEFAEEK